MIMKLWALMFTLMFVNVYSQVLEFKSDRFAVVKPLSKVTFFEAKEICARRYDTALASIHSLGEQNEVTALLEQIDDKTLETAIFGLNDLAEEGVYRFVDGTHFDFQFRQISNPDNHDLLDCGRLTRTRNALWRWAAFDCNKIHPLVVCNAPSTRYAVPSLYQPDSSISAGEARQLCKDVYGNDAGLATIANQMDLNEAIRVSEQFYQKQPWLNGGPFIALNDIREEGVWIWADDTPLTIYNWRIGQPDVDDRRMGVVYMEKTYGYEMADITTGVGFARVFPLCDLVTKEKMACEYVRGNNAWKNKCPRATGEGRCLNGRRSRFCKWAVEGHCVHFFGEEANRDMCAQWQSEVECPVECRWTEY